MLPLPILVTVTTKVAAPPWQTGLGDCGPTSTAVSVGAEKVSLLHASMSGRTKRGTNLCLFIQTFCCFLSRPFCKGAYTGPGLLQPGQLCRILPVKPGTRPKGFTGGRMPRPCALANCQLS